MKTNDNETGKRSPRSRHIRDTANLSPIRLTPRDLELLTALSEYRLLTTTQIRKLFFRSHHRARKRLFKLWQHKLVDRLFRPVSLGDRPVDVIYKLAANGARLLARQKGFAEQAIPEARRVKQLSPLFLDHTLAVNDFRIALEITCKKSTDTRLLSWREGKSIKFEEVLVDRSRSPLLVRVPIMADGYFVIEIENRQLHYFVEVDRGTMALGRWRRRFSAYCKKVRGGTLSASPEFTRPRVLIVTSSQVRQQNLIKIVQRHPGAAQRTAFFEFSLLSQIEKEGVDLIHEKIWTNSSLERGSLVRDCFGVANSQAAQG